MVSSVTLNYQMERAVGFLRELYNPVKRIGLSYLGEVLLGVQPAGLFCCFPHYTSASRIKRILIAPKERICAIFTATFC
jgi:hypothetical protein